MELRGCFGSTFFGWIRLSWARYSNHVSLWRAILSQKIVSLFDLYLHCLLPPPRGYSKLTSTERRRGKVTKNGDILINNSSLSLPLSLSLSLLYHLYVLIRIKSLQMHSFCVIGNRWSPWVLVVHHVSECWTSFTNLAEYFCRIPLTIIW